MTLASLIALSWKPEMRGIVLVLVGFVVLCGSVYLLVATNIGARMGFLLALGGLFGWMFVMGAIWWVYGIGMQGRQPTWEPADPVAIVKDGDLLGAGILENEADPVAEGWDLLAEEDPKRGQAVASADVILQDAGAFDAGQYEAIAVYDKGGDRYPKINDTLDFIAFRHEPRYSLVEVQAVVPVLTEPGRAPLEPELDESQPKTYVLMIRDLGSRRQPAIVLTFGSALIIGVVVWLMNRRERMFHENRSGGLVKATAGA